MTGKKTEKQGDKAQAAKLPTIDVIIPNYNSGGRLRDTLTSIKAQTSPVHEIIVIDDHSSQEEQAFLASLMDEFVNLRLVVLLENSGAPSKPRNLGIDIATADYVAFVDSGDIWLAEKICRQMPLLQAGYPAVSANYYVQSHEGEKRSIVNSPEIISFEMQAKRNFIGSPTGTIKRLLSPRFHVIGHEDYLYWIEVTRMTPVRNCGGAALAVHYRDRGSRSSQLFQNILSVFAVFKFAKIPYPFLKTLNYTIAGVLRRFRVWSDLRR